MTKLPYRIRNIRADADRYGWMRTIENRVFRFAALFLGVHVHVVRITEMRADPVFPSSNADLNYRQVETEELYTASADPDMKLSRKFVEAAIKREDPCFGAFDGSLLVSYIWRTETAAPHRDHIWTRVSPPYCYAYKSFTHPGYRGQRISPGVHLCSDTVMLKRGYTHRVGFVEITNWASLAMGKHMRSQIIGRAGYIMLFGLYIPFRSKAVKAIGFEFFDRKVTDSVN